MFSAMRYQSGVLELIDQRLLPAEAVWLACSSCEDVACAIEDMVVRGAPAIGCAAAYGLAVACSQTDFPIWSQFKDKFFAYEQRLRATRPTAVNLFYALDQMHLLAQSFEANMPKDDVVKRVEILAEELYRDDLTTCKTIGKHGASIADGPEKLSILTHCNTGSLATAGYGTALGVIRALYEQNKLAMVYVDETRPYLQGSRLTAFELASEGIPHQVITDSCAAYLMQLGKVDWAIVGADRITANGDTANKIGTYSVAVNCKFHNVKFFVAAPLATFDFNLTDGQKIVVEERPTQELEECGSKRLMPFDSPAFNPSFDITPANLISGIICEKGVIFEPNTEKLKSFR